MKVELNVVDSTVWYFLFFFNVVVLVGGVVLLVLGTIIIIEIDRYDAFFDDQFSAPTIILLTCGSLIMVSGFFGCCGAFRQYFWMLLTFACCMAVIFVLQLVGGVLAFTFQNQLDATLENNLRVQMELCADPEAGDEPKNAWDTLQKNFQCCGVENFSDWYNVLGIVDLSEFCGCDVNNENICLPNGLYSEGCLKKLQGYFTQMQTALGAVGISFAVLQLVGAVFSSILTYSLRRNDR